MSRIYPSTSREVASIIKKLTPIGYEGDVKCMHITYKWMNGKLSVTTDVRDYLS